MRLKKPKMTRKRLYILVPIIVLILGGILTTLLIIRHHDQLLTQKADAAKTSSNNKPLPASYNYAYPATKLLNWNQKYTVNGVQYELTGTSQYVLTSSGGSCPDILTKYGCSNGIPVTEVDFTLTNVSGQTLDYTSCFESGATCTAEEAANQSKVYQSLDFGCVAQLTNGQGTKSYKTNADDKSVYSWGGYYGDYPFNSTDDPEALPVNDTVAAAINPKVNNGTGGTSLQLNKMQFAVGETKTAKVQVDSMQCVAVGAPDKSVFWGLPL